MSIVSGDQFYTVVALGSHFCVEILLTLSLQMRFNWQGNSKRQGNQALYCEVCRWITVVKHFTLWKYIELFRRNLVDPSALRDIKDASAFEIYRLPKLYIKQYYCVEAAVHQRIVRVRSAEDRKNREAPSRLKRGGKALRCSKCCYKTNGVPPFHHDIINGNGQRLTGKSCDGVFE